MGIAKAIEEALTKATLVLEIEEIDKKLPKALEKKVTAAKKATADSATKVEKAGAELAREQFDALEAQRAEKYKQLEVLYGKD